MAAVVGTVVIDRSWSAKGIRYRIADITFDTGTWATAGYALSPSTFNLADRIDAVACIAHGGYVPSWDAAAQKLRLFYANNDGGADGPLITYPASAMVANSIKCLIVGV